MKRLAVLTLVVGLLAAFACSQAVMAGKPDDKPGDRPTKVLIRHLAEVIPDESGLPDLEVRVYRVIEVSSKAVAAHLAHGDMLAEPGDARGDVIIDEPDPGEDPGGEG